MKQDGVTDDCVRNWEITKKDKFQPYLIFWYSVLQMTNQSILKLMNC